MLLFQPQIGHESHPKIRSHSTLRETIGHNEIGQKQYGHKTLSMITLLIPAAKCHFSCTLVGFHNFSAQCVVALNDLEHVNPIRQPTHVNLDIVLAFGVDGSDHHSKRVE